MTKSDLIDKLADETNFSTREATEIINTLLARMTDALANGQDIQIRGFGSFSVKDYKPYTGRNPMTGEEIKVKPKKLPFFKVGKELRERVNEGK